VNNSALTLKEEVARWIEANRAHGVTQTSLAKAIAFSGSAVSDVIAGKYKGNPAPIETRILQYIRNYGVKEAPSNDIWIETSQTKAAREAVVSAIEEGKMAALYGDSGAGKTSFIKRFLGDRPNAVYLEIVRGQGTRDVLREICAGLKIMPKRSNYQTLCEICLNIGDRVIVIDQAEFLRGDTMEMLRAISDRVKATIVLIGIHQLINVLGAHDHLRNRIKFKWVFQLLKDTELKSLCEQYGINPALSANIAKLAHRNFRSTTYLLENAIKFAHGEEVTSDLLTAAKAMLFI
jgi:DNA transposition AAA+ family ATPase